MDQPPGPSNNKRPRFGFKKGKLVKRVSCHSADLEELVCNTLFDEEEEDDFIDDSDVDPDYVEESDHSTGSEQGCSENEDCPEGINCNDAEFVSTANSENNNTIEPLPPQNLDSVPDTENSKDTNTASIVNLSNVDRIIEDVITTAMLTDPDGIRKGDATYVYGRRNTDMVNEDNPEDINFNDMEFVSPSNTESDKNSESLPPQNLDSVPDKENSNDTNAATSVNLSNIDRVIDDVITTAMLTDPDVRRRGDATYFYGRRNKDMVKKGIMPVKWRKTAPPVTVRTRQENIVTRLPGLKAAAKNIGPNPNEEEVWNLFFTEDILQTIVYWTNKKIIEVRPNYHGKKKSHTHDLDVVELKGLIGLLIYSAVFKSGNESVLSLFATDGTGREVFRCVMAQKRFLFLLQVLRFDNPDDRLQRKKDNPDAAIHEIFNQFIQNCQSCYTPGAFLCIDEMLTPFRGRCSFRMYLPKKPAKYGLKIQCMTDAKTHYLFNAYLYTGKGSDGKNLSDAEKKFKIPTQAVLRLAQPLLNTGRNVTADNWYSSVELAEELLKKKTTFIGTMKKNKVEIPEAFQPNRAREVNSTLYGFTENMTLISHCPKKSKVVVLISTMHHTDHRDETTGKPEIIADYNSTKGGVDTVDQMCANYCSTRRSQRWPMSIFFMMVNVSAGVNSYVLYQAYEQTDKKITRLDFMKNLARFLTHPLMHRRLNKGFLSQDMKLSIKRILGMEEDDAPALRPHEHFEKRKTCVFCPPRLKRKTKYPCQMCQKPICLECSRNICPDCYREAS